MGHATKTATGIAIIEKAAAKIGAFLVHNDDIGNASDGTRLEYAYFADETETYWLVSEDSLFRLGAKDMDYNAWAEEDKDAKEFGKRSPKRRTP